MADAARSVKHYVSDCLAERHPYDVQKGFAGSRARDAGKAFDGFVPAGGIDNLLNSLTDVSTADEERARAVRHLYAHSASQEAKVELVQKGVVPTLVAVLSQKPCNMLRHQCFLLLWSLCVLPQGCYPVVQCGGIEAALQALQDGAAGERAEKDTTNTQVRVAAASVIAQAASNAAGARWMLRAEDWTELVLPGVEYPPAALAPPPSVSSSAGVADGSAAPAPDVLLAGLSTTLRREPLGESKVALHCATALAHLSNLAPGVELITGEASPAAELIPAVAEQLGQYADILLRHVRESATADRTAPLTPSLAYLTQLLTIAWNVAMDQRGVELLDKNSAPDCLFALFAVVRQGGIPSVPTLVQRSLMGALSAASKLSSVKLASTSPLPTAPSASPAGGDGGETRVTALLFYLQEINGLVDEARAAGREPANDLIAMLKNTVQCIRLASEVKAVRDTTHAFLDRLDRKENSHDGFYFRRQLYCRTQWEAEFDASV